MSIENILEQVDLHVANEKKGPWMSIQEKAAYAAFAKAALPQMAAEIRRLQSELDKKKEG